MKIKELALIWMSVGNSYFTEERIEKLMKFADKNFKKIIIMSPDIPAEHTFRALGYEENESRKRARYDSNLLKNRTKRKIDKLINKNKFEIWEWKKDVSENELYKKEYKKIKSLYQSNDKFRKDARSTTKKVLQNQYRKPKNMKSAIDEAVLYLIEELALVFSLPERYNKKIAYLYHRKWPIFENLISGKYDGIKRKNISFKLTGIQ